MRGAFDSAQSLWQGARPDAARLLDSRSRHPHQVQDFPPRRLKAGLYEEW
jgi:hypothetical protein